MSYFYYNKFDSGNFDQTYAYKTKVKYDSIYTFGQDDDPYQWIQSDIEESEETPIPENITTEIYGVTYTK